MKLPFSSTVFLIAATALITYQATYTSVENRHRDTVYTLTETEKTSYTKLAAIDDIVRSTYINDINEQDLEDGLIRGYLYGINDKYASYLTAEEFRLYTEESNGEMTGIGITVIYDTSLGGLYVSSVVDNSPAMLAGIREGDIVLAVDGETIADRGYYDTIHHITSAKEGTPLTVTVQKGPDYIQVEEYSLTRAIINNKTVEYRLLTEGNTGYIKISSFHTTTPKEFIEAMEDLQKSGAERFIFDVRSNPGGELTSISTILDYLLPEGPIIRIQSKNSEETVIKSDANFVDAPMVVLVNGSTASAAELFTSALRDYEKAAIVGTTTYGKGTVQTMRQLPDELGGGAISISTGMYSPPFSDNYEGVGIVPDCEVEVPEELRDIFYKLALYEDPQFLKALELINADAPDGTIILPDGPITSTDNSEANTGDSSGS